MTNLIILFLILASLSGCAAKTSLIEVPKSCFDVASCTKLVRLKLQSHLILDDSAYGHKVVIQFQLDDKANAIEVKVL